jgi:hypothetical protein
MKIGVTLHLGEGATAAVAQQQSHSSSQAMHTTGEWTRLHMRRRGVVERGEGATAAAAQQCKGAASRQGTQTAGASTQR